MKERLLASFQDRVLLDDLLTDVLKKQRESFGKNCPKACPADDSDDDAEAPPDPDEDVAVRAEVAQEMDAKATFATSDAWRRPSDYVAFMARRFEDEWTNPRTGRKESRPLKRDQVFFVTKFAEACNAVWEDDRKVQENELDVSKIRCFNILLMGQGIEHFCVFFLFC